MKISIRSKHGTHKIAGKIVGHKFVDVDEDALKKYGSTRMGTIVLNKCIEFASDSKSKKAENNSVVAGLRAEAKEYKERIQRLEAENLELNKKLIESHSGDDSNLKSDVELKKELNDEPFVFDPEKHSVEHRGGGSYFVVDEKNEKVRGPLSEDEKEKYKAMQTED